MSASRAACAAPLALLMPAASSLPRASSAFAASAFHADKSCTKTHKAGCHTTTVSFSYASKLWSRPGEHQETSKRLKLLMHNNLLYASFLPRCTAEHSVTLCWTGAWTASTAEHTIISMGFDSADGCRLTMHSKCIIKGILGRNHPILSKVDV